MTTPLGACDPLGGGFKRGASPPRSGVGRSAHGPAPGPHSIPHAGVPLAGHSERIIVATGYVRRVGDRIDTETNVTAPHWPRATPQRFRARRRSEAKTACTKRPSTALVSGAS